MADTTRSEDFDYESAVADLDGRVAVIRRYRRLLELQKDRLDAYLRVIDHREAALAEGSFDNMETYTELEQDAIRGIMTVQRCIEPLKILYLELHPRGSEEIIALEARLERLRQEVIARNEASRLALRTQADVLKAELAKLRTRKQPASLFAGAGSATMVDISL